MGADRKLGHGPAPATMKENRGQENIESRLRNPIRKDCRRCAKFMQLLPLSGSQKRMLMHCFSRRRTQWSRVRRDLESGWRVVHLATCPVDERRGRFLCFFL